MLFHHQGEALDLDQMITFQTGNPGEPTVYLSTDRRHVIVLTMDRTKGASLHKAEASEIAYLAQKYNLPQLLEALP